MFLKIRNLIFNFVLIIRTIIAISSNRWLVSWLSLEINLIILIPLLVNKISFNATNITIKYFLTQAFASLLIISSFIIFFMFRFANSIIINNELIIVAIIIKSGIPPFQFWLPQVLELRNLFQSFIILTWQKIAPFVFLSYIFSRSILLFLIAAAIVGCMGGLNQNSIIKIIAYSSIIHASWIISAILVSEKTWICYFLAYATITLAFIIFITNFKFKKISSFLKNYIGVTTKIIFSVNILSIGGLPPFLGFVAKIIVIQKIITVKMVRLLILIVSASFISLLYYTRICYALFLTGGKGIKLKPGVAKTEKNLPNWTRIGINIIALPLVLLT